MSESDPLSRAELERFDPQPLARGDSQHYLCPFCHDERQGRPRDNAHRKLRVWPHGAWYCVRCERRGLLDEFKTPRNDNVSAAYKKGRDTQRRRRSAAGVDVNPRNARVRAPAAPASDSANRGKNRGSAKRPRTRPAPAAANPEPSPAELDEDARKRARLRRLWSAALPLADPLAVGGRVYLQRRGIPADVAEAGRVRFAYEWGSVNTYLGPALAFPLQDESGRLVAAEGRFVTPPAGVAKSHSAGAKSRGVFEALPGALAADGVTLCEGPFTALSVAACGFPAVALCGHVVRPWLVRQLAGRVVFVSLDWYEAKAEDNGAAACRALAAWGATPYRLAPPDGAGDWNDRLQAVGLDALRAELDAAIVGALVPRE